MLLWLGIAAGSAVLLDGLLEPIVVIVLGVPLKERQQRGVILEKHVWMGKKKELEQIHREPSRRIHIAIQTFGLIVIHILRII